MPIRRSARPITRRMVQDYCRARVAPVMPPRDVDSVSRFLRHVLETGCRPPRVGSACHWKQIARGAELGLTDVLATRQYLIPILDAVSRSTDEGPQWQPVNHPVVPAVQGESMAPPVQGTLAKAKLARERNYRKRPIVACPEPLWTEWQDVDTFAEALDLHIRRHGDRGTGASDHDWTSGPTKA